MAMPTQKSGLNGILVLDKPAGMTSHDVVDRVRKGLNIKRVGHGGTLDPDATGVLVIGVGPAVRLLSYAQSATKAYVARGRLGIVTTTQDASGSVISERQVDVARGDLDRAARNLVGNIEQVPPMVSALKVGGERLYKRARRGEEVEREPRRVTVYEMRVTSFESPDFSMEVTCSAGTYVRTLVHDIGDALACGAHLTSLRRTSSGGFDEKDAIPLEGISGDALRPPLEAVDHLPRIDLSPETAALVRNGRRLPLLVDDVAGEVALVESGDLLAVYRRDGEELVPERVVSG